MKYVFDGKIRDIPRSSAESVATIGLLLAVKIKLVCGLEKDQTNIWEDNEKKWCSESKS